MRIALCLVVLAAAAEAAQTVRVGVFSLFRPQRLVAKPAPGELLRVEIDGRVSFLEGAQTVAFRREGEALDCFLHRELVTARRARVSARDGGAARFSLGVPGRIERSFHGTLEVAARAGALDAVVALDLEAAVASVVAAESPPEAPHEALKAQAVVARSYFLATRGRHVGFDFCDTTHCQFLREPAADLSPASETAGLVLAYQSSVVGALYSAACGGRTKSLAEVGLADREYPFFPVVCEPCRRAPRAWTAHFSGGDAERLRANPHSEPVRLEIVRRLGWSALPSNHYELEDTPGGLVLHGTGAGHGVGLCQRGAAAMAAAGADYRAILRHYFQATALQEGTVR